MVVSSNHKKPVVDGLILSSGRTGTTYIAEALNNNPSLSPFFIRQEPPPSRSLYMLSNMAHICPKSQEWAWHIFESSRRKIQTDKPYIEINPFLTGIAAKFTKDDIRNGVVHIVRDPVGWVQSVLAFGGYSWRSLMTPYLPFAHERPVMAGRSWYGLSIAEKMAWRWLYRNLQIAEMQERNIPYLCLRYEDLFDKSHTPSPALLQQIFIHTGGIDMDFSKLPLVREKVNASTRPQKKALPPETIERIYEITKPLAEKYGYA